MHLNQDVTEDTLRVWRTISTTLNVRSYSDPTRGVTEIKPIFFLINQYYNYSDIYVYHRYIVYKVRIIFPQSLLHYQHTFSAFARASLCVGLVKLFAEASEIFRHAVFQLVFRKTALSESNLQGPKKMEVGGC